MTLSVEALTTKTQIFKFVPHGDAEAYIALGWQPKRSLCATHHGYSASLMEWPHDRPPEEPSCQEVPCA